MWTDQAPLHRPVANGGGASGAMPRLNLSAPPPAPGGDCPVAMPLVERLSGLLRKIELFMGC